jgi:hypothetical protein
MSIVSKFKGFGATPQPKLIKGWLLPECQKHYTDEAYNVESLKTTINLWVGYFCQRKKDDKDGLEARIAVSTSSFGMLCQVDPMLERLDECLFKSLLTSLKDDAEFYIAFIDKIYWKVKERVDSGDTEDLSILVKESADYKEWLAERGIVSSRITLKDGWIHPLSDTNTVNGEDTMNTWAFASLVCGTATGRLEDGNKDRAVSMLISEGVLDVKNWQARLQLCEQLDAVYVQLINDLHSKLEQKIDKAFG